MGCIGWQCAVHQQQYHNNSNNVECNCINHRKLPFNGDSAYSCSGTTTTMTRSRTMRKRSSSRSNTSTMERGYVFSRNRVLIYYQLQLMPVEVHESSFALILLCWVQSVQFIPPHSVSYSADGRGHHPRPLLTYNNINQLRKPSRVNVKTRKLIKWISDNFQVQIPNTNDDRLNRCKTHLLVTPRLGKVIPINSCVKFILLLSQQSH